MSINTYGFKSLSDRALAFAGDYELEAFELACKAAREDLDALDAEDARDRETSEQYREIQNDARRGNILERLDAARQNVEAAGESLAEAEKAPFASSSISYHSPRGTETVGPFLPSRVPGYATCACVHGGYLVARQWDDGHLTPLGCVCEDGRVFEGCWPNEELVQDSEQAALWRSLR